MCVFQVSASSDDAGQNPANCSYQTNWNEIYMGECSNHQDITSGFRFENIDLLPDAQVSEAHLEFTVDGPYTDDLNIRIYGQAVGNASTFTLTTPPSNQMLRPRTSAFVDWHIPSSDRWELGQIRVSPDLSAIIEEITSGPDWQSDNALVFIIENIGPSSGDNLHRRVIGYDRPVWYPGTENAARLIIHLGTAIIDQPTIIGRSEWNCPVEELEAPDTIPVPQDPSMVVVHHTTSRNDPTQDTKDSNDKYQWAKFSDLAPGGIPLGTVSQYYDPIKDTWSGDVLMVWLVERYRTKWTDTAYHYLIDGDGNIYQGSYYGIGYEKGATCSEVSDMVQVAFLGCFEPGKCDKEGGASTPSSAATNSLVSLIDWIGCSETQFLLSTGGTEDNILGHKDIDDGSVPQCSTDCPGVNLYNLLPQIRQQSFCPASTPLVQYFDFQSDNQLVRISTESESLPTDYVTIMGHNETIYITDPQGRHLGIDSLTGNIINEIPGADIEDNPTWEDGGRGDSNSTPDRLVIAHIPIPIDGIYRVQLQGDLSSLGSGLSLTARHEGELKADSMVMAEVDRPLANEYQFTYTQDNDELVSSLFLDNTAPTIIYELAGTQGENDWFVSNIILTLEANDDLSGVSMIQYSLDGNDWGIYTEPIPISIEGEHIFQYASKDLVGNQEETHTLEIFIDKEPPIISITQPENTIHWFGSSFTISYEAYDNVSGIHEIIATLDEENIANDQVVDTLFLEPGTHDIIIKANDLAGLQSIQSLTIDIQANIEGLIIAKHKFYDLGGIFGPGANGIINSLDVKLDAAINARDRGKFNVVINHLNSFINEVEAQTGNHITQDAAAILINYANLLIAQYE